MRPMAPRARTRTLPSGRQSPHPSSSTCDEADELRDGSSSMETGLDRMGGGLGRGESTAFGAGALRRAPTEMRISFDGEDEL